MRSVLIESGVAGVLAVLLGVSGVWVVETKHESRQRFAELQELKREQDRLQIDWGRLQLEQSAWATHARIESLARNDLNLAEPTVDQLKMVAERRP